MKRPEVFGSPPPRCPETPPSPRARKAAQADQQPQAASQQQAPSRQSQTTRRSRATQQSQTVQQSRPARQKKKRGPAHVTGTESPSVPASPKIGHPPRLPHRLWPTRDTSLAASALRDARRRLTDARRERRRYERAEIRRFTQRARARRRIWFICTSIVVGLVVFVVAGAYSPLMALRTIQIEGASRIDAAAVRDALAPYIGQPLPLVDSDTVQKELERFPAIRSFAAESRPPGTLLVRVVERVPLGVVPSPSGFDLVDNAGVVLESAPERPGGFPLIQADGGVRGNGFRATTAVLHTLPSEIVSRVDSISATTADDVALTFAGVPQRIIWGSAENSDYKVLVLGRLLAVNDLSVPTTFDVSSPESPIVQK